MTKNRTRIETEQTLVVTCHGDLARLVKKALNDNQVTYRFRQNPSVKDVIEACGIPHTEVDLILVDDISVDFTCQVRAGDHLHVYPPRCLSDRPDLIHLADGPLSNPRFILDVHLGKLCRKLRLLGFDCLYRNDYEDREIVDIGVAEQRTVLTRDRGILKYAVVRSGLLIRHDNDLLQAAQILNRYQLWEQIRLETRCPLCNGLLEAVEKRVVFADLKPETRRCCHAFRRCRSCSQIYWQGAHSNQTGQWLTKLNALRIK